VSGPELQTVFPRLVRHPPNLRLAAPLDQLAVRADLLTGLTALLVAW